MRRLSRGNVLIEERWATATFMCFWRRSELVAEGRCWAIAGWLGARRASATVPVVFTIGDPVQLGWKLVSTALPGGNVTWNRVRVPNQLGASACAAVATTSCPASGLDTRWNLVTPRLSRHGI